MTATVGATAVLILVSAALLMIYDPGDQPEPSGPPQSSSRPAPTNVPPANLRLRDGGATITLTWTDPSEGTLPFVVAGGHAGRTLGAMATVEPGRTSYTVNGLSSRVDYCFAVLAVYSTDTYATSGQVCTRREETASPR